MEIKRQISAQSCPPSQGGGPREEKPSSKQIVPSPSREPVAKTEDGARRRWSRWSRRGGRRGRRSLRTVVKSDNPEFGLRKEILREAPWAKAPLDQAKVEPRAVHEVTAADKEADASDLPEPSETF